MRICGKIDLPYGVTGHIAGSGCIYYRNKNKKDTCIMDMGYESIGEGKCVMHV